jgi:hypothetical protein
MTNEMKQFLTELADLLEKHDAYIEVDDCLIEFYIPQVGYKPTRESTVGVTWLKELLK